jgi:hypothetical protein
MSKLCFYCRNTINQEHFTKKFIEVSCPDHHNMGFRINMHYHPHCYRRYKNMSSKEVFQMRDLIQKYIMNELNIRIE